MSLKQALVEPPPELLQIPRRWRLDLERRPRHRMRELEPPRVKRVARELEAREVHRGQLAVGAALEARLVRPIELVPHNGRAERREVQADLMLPPGLEIAAHARVLRPAHARARRRLHGEARRR